MAKARYRKASSAWVELWLQSARVPLLWWELWLASAQTIALRSSAIAAAGLTPNARQQRENQRMVTEKALAGMETLRFLFTPNPALPLAYWRLWSSLGRAPMGVSSWTPLLDIPLTIGEQALASWNGAIRPWHRRARANARRLGSA